MEIRPASDEDKVMAGIAYLGVMFFFIPTVVILILKKESSYIKFHCFQALSFILFGAFCMVVCILQSILAMIPILGFILWTVIALAMGLLGLAAFIYCIILAVKTFSGETMEIPYVAPYIRSKLLQ